VGIALSTLHQSSLGSLFLIMPYRLHPLWYSPILPVLFFVSAVALGLMMVIFENHFTAYLYRRKPETEQLGPLGAAARWVLILYLALRFGDLAARGQLHYLVSGTWQAKTFWGEIILMAMVPLVLLSVPQFQRQRNWQWATAATVVSGIVLNRIDVGGLVDLSRGSPLYLPRWTEIAVSLGIVAAATLVFLFMIEHFKVWQERPADSEADPRKLAEFQKVDTTWLGSPRVAARTKYSLTFVLAAAVSFSFLGNPRAASLGVAPTPVHKARGGEILDIDANLDGYGVAFYHQREIERNGGKQSCVICHHMNLPHDKGSGCYECHRDMYLPADAFRHDWHASPTGARLACLECHPRGQVRSAVGAKSCADCHKDLIPAGATIKIKSYTAPAYVDAMHRLCIGCHAKVAERENKPDVARCAECHKGNLNFSEAENVLDHRRALMGRGMVLPPVVSQP